MNEDLDLPWRIRCNVSVIVRTGRAVDLDPVVDYLKSRVPSFEILSPDQAGTGLRCLATFRRRQPVARLPGPCIPGGARVIELSDPPTWEQLDAQLRRSAD